MPILPHRRRCKRTATGPSISHDQSAISLAIGRSPLAGEILQVCAKSGAWDQNGDEARGEFNSGTHSCMSMGPAWNGTKRMRTESRTTSVLCGWTELRLLETRKLTPAVCKGTAFSCSWLRIKMAHPSAVRHKQGLLF